MAVIDTAHPASPVAAPREEIPQRAANERALAAEREADAVLGAPPQAGRSARQVVTLIVRPVVSLVLLGVVFWKLGAGNVWQTLRAADPVWLGAGAAIVVLALLISAWKWQILLAAHDLRVPFGRLFTAYLIGQFFNNFLPSNIGGDVARVHDVVRFTGRGAATASSVIGERLLAGLALAVTAGVALLFSLRASAQVGGSVALVLVLFGGLCYAVAAPRARAAAGRALPRLRGTALARVAGHMGDAFGNRDAVARVMVLSFAFQASVVLLGWATFVAIGVPVSLGACFLFIPIISALQLVPISLNGFGVREGAYIFFFGSQGVGRPEAVAASLLFTLLVSAVSLGGGVLFATRRH